MMMAESGVVVVKAVREDAVEETATVVKKRRVADEAEVWFGPSGERGRRRPRRRNRGADRKERRRRRWHQRDRLGRRRRGRRNAW